MAGSRNITSVFVPDEAVKAAMKVRRVSLAEEQFIGFCDTWAVLAEAALMSGKISQLLNYFNTMNPYYDAQFPNLTFFHVPTRDAANTIDDFGNKAQMITQWFLHMANFTDGGSYRIERRKKFRQIAALEDTPVGGRTLEVKQLFGIYSSCDLITYINGLRFLVENNEDIKYPVCFTLDTTRHRLLLGYLPENRKWYIVNSGQLLQINLVVNTASIVKMIQQGLGNKHQVAVTTRISSGEYQQSIVLSALEKLAQQTPWQLLHTAETQAKRIDDTGTTVLHLAVLDSQTEWVNELLHHGAVVSQRKIEDGQTVLHSAICGNSLSIVQLLLKQDPSVIDAQDRYGRTPLFYAAMRGYEELAQALITSQAKIDLADRRGITPLEIAKSENHQAVVDLLSRFNGKLPVIASEQSERGDPIYNAW